MVTGGSAHLTGAMMSTVRCGGPGPGPAPTTGSSAFACLPARLGALLVPCLRRANIAGHAASTSALLLVTSAFTSDITARSSARVGVGVGVIAVEMVGVRSAGHAQAEEEIDEGEEVDGDDLPPLLGHVGVHGGVRRC